MLDEVFEIRVRSFDLHLEDGTGGRTLFGAAMGEVGGPVSVVEGVLEELGFVDLGGVIAALGEHVGFQVVIGREALDLGNNKDVGEFALLDLVGFNADGEGALQDAEDGVEVPFADGLEGERNGDDDVGVHGFDIRGGEIFEDGAVDVLVTGELEGAKDAGDGGGGADGIGEGAAGEGDGAGVGEIGGLAAEGDGEVVEVGLVVVVKKLFVEKGVEAGVGEQAVAQGDTVFQADAYTVGKVAVFFAATVVECSVVGAEAKDAGDLLAGEDVTHLLGGVAGGVERGKDGAHGGAGDDVDGDVVLFEPLDGADFGEGDGRAAAKGKADDGASLGQIGGRYRGISGGKTEFCGGGGIFLSGTRRFGGGSRVLAVLLLALR